MPFLIGIVLSFSYDYPICVITRGADTGRVPPAKGVIVSAAALPAGLRTVKIELTDVAVIEASHKWILSVY